MIRIRDREMGPEQVILFKLIICSIIDLSKMTYFNLS
nr:MAG TPA: hypothetical protein [Caudoviricetes sp.]